MFKLMAWYLLERIINIPAYCLIRLHIMVIRKVLNALKHKRQKLQYRIYKEVPMKFTPKRGLFRLVIVAVIVLVCLPIAKDVRILCCMYAVLHRLVALLANRWFFRFVLKL